MRPYFVALFVLCAGSTAASAQNYATVDQSGGISSQSISQTKRVERTFNVTPLAPNVVVLPQGDQAPVYEPFEPIEFDVTGYQVATEPMPALLPPPVLHDGLVENVPVFTAPIDVTPQSDDHSRPLGSPETFASTGDIAPLGEVGFQSETETSRLLLALEDKHTARLAELKVRHLAQRKAMLDQFEKDAADPAKVIGLAARMRTSLAELEVAQKAMLQVEETQFMAATLKVLDAAPSRAE